MRRRERGGGDTSFPALYILIFLVFWAPSRASASELTTWGMEGERFFNASIREGTCTINQKMK